MLNAENMTDKLYEAVINDDAETLQSLSNQPEYADMLTNDDELFMDLSSFAKEFNKLAVTHVLDSWGADEQHFDFDASVQFALKNDNWRYLHTLKALRPAAFNNGIKHHAPKACNQLNLGGLLTFYRALEHLSLDNVIAIITHDDIFDKDRRSGPIYELLKNNHHRLFELDIIEPHIPLLDQAILQSIHQFSEKTIHFVCKYLVIRLHHHPHDYAFAETVIKALFACDNTPSDILNNNVIRALVDTTKSLFSLGIYNIDYFQLIHCIFSCSPAIRVEHYLEVERSFIAKAGIIPTFTSVESAVLNQPALISHLDLMAKYDPEYLSGVTLTIASLNHQGKGTPEYLLVLLDHAVSFKRDHTPPAEYEQRFITSVEELLKNVSQRFATHGMTPFIAKVYAMAYSLNPHHELPDSIDSITMHFHELNKFDHTGQVTNGFRLFAYNRLLGVPLDEVFNGTFLHDENSIIVLSTQYDYYTLLDAAQTDTNAQRLINHLLSS